METWEIEPLLARLRHRNGELQALQRLTAWAVLQANSRHRIDPRDVATLPWEEEEQAAEEEPATEEDIRRLRDKANALAAKMKQDGEKK